MKKRHWIFGTVCLVGGCAGPLDRQSDQLVREAIFQIHQEHLRQFADGGLVQVRRETSDVETELTEERRRALDRSSGVEAYREIPVRYGQDLLGQEDANAVALSLERAMAMALEGNLQLQSARLMPAISASQVDQAESIFDVVLLGSTRWEKLDTPRPPGSVPGLASDVQSENLVVSAGLRKLFQTGGTVTLQTDLTRSESDPSVFSVDSYYNARVMLGLTQPLLRGFGSEVNRAQVVLARHASAAEAARLKLAMLTVAFEVERAYWQLRFARQQLQIQTKLLERTVEDRDRLIQRRDFDVSPVRITEANSFVEARRAEVIRARQGVRDASDQLKRLLHASDLPLASEVLLIATDEPSEEPLTFSLLDGVTMALQRRPEMEVARLGIADARVRQVVADNATLPVLNLIAQVAASGIDLEEPLDAYSNVADLDYIDYVLGGEFEYPWGNRGAEALQTQRRLETRRATLDYQQQAQSVVFEVKTALRRILTSYELIGATRASRRAAADSLRAIEEQEKAGVALTPEFLLDLKLSTQERLANAENQEAQARVDYQVAIAQLYLTTGTLLEQKGIDFDIVEASDTRRR